jgi:heterodisulfide reductase subunit B
MSGQVDHAPFAGYLYYPGCSLKGTGIAYEESLLVLFRMLELPMKELTDWNCCGATTYMGTDERQAFLLAARNLSLARQAGGADIVAPCNACYLSLRKCMDYATTHKSVGDDVHAYLEGVHLPTLQQVAVRHPLEVLYTDVGLDRLRAGAVRKWQGGPVACYYGCQAVRPYSEVDRESNPTRMDDMLNAIGVPTVPFALKTKCCGASHTGTIRDVGVRLSYILLREAVRQGAKAVVTICPLCQFNLDLFQADMRKTDPSLPDVPILYLTQVVAWALGADTKDLGIHRCVAGSELVRSWFAAEKGALTHA